MANDADFRFIVGLFSNFRNGVVEKPHGCGMGIGTTKFHRQPLVAYGAPLVETIVDCPRPRNGRSDPLAAFLRRRASPLRHFHQHLRQPFWHIHHDVITAGNFERAPSSVGFTDAEILIENRIWV